MTATELTPYAGGQAEEYQARVIMTPEAAKALDEQVRRCTEAVLREGTDYGVIPGTSGEKTLWRPGAQKLLQWFGLGYTCDRVEVERDDQGRKHGITYKCTVGRRLPDGSVDIKATCEGTADYDESKFYQSAEEVQRKAEYNERKWAKQYGRVADPTKWKNRGEYRADWNALMKRCLAASTPLLVKSPAGEYLTEATRLYSWISRPTAPKVHIPGPDGEWVPVTGMFRNGIQPVLRITLRDGTEHRVTASHRFLTSRGLVAAGDLATGDTLTRRTIPLAGMKEPDPDFGWLVGLVIADGNVTRWGVRITLGQDEEHLADRAAWIGRRLGCPARYQQRTDMKAWLVTISGPAIIGLLKQFTAGKDSYGKHLRGTAWRGGSDFLDGVLRGWLDGDGSWIARPGQLGYWRVGFTGHNDRWLRDLRTLGAILGYRVSVRTGSSKAGGKTFGTFVGDVKPPARTRGNNADPGQVMSVEPDGETMTYDLEVGTADHLYLLHDGTVTHNSQKRAIVGAVVDATAAGGIFADREEDEAPAPAADDGGPSWYEQAIEAALTFTDVEIGRALYVDAAQAHRDGQCTRRQQDHVQNTITQRVKLLKTVTPVDVEDLADQAARDVAAGDDTQPAAQDARPRAAGAASSRGAQPSPSPHAEMRRHFTRLGFGDSDEDTAARIRHIARITGRTVTPGKPLTDAEAQHVADELAGCEDWDALDAMLNDGEKPGETDG